MTRHGNAFKREKGMESEQLFWSPSLRSVCGCRLVDVHRVALKRGPDCLQPAYLTDDCGDNTERGTINQAGDGESLS